MIRQLFKERQEKKRNPSHDQLREAIKDMATKEGLEYVRHDLHGLERDIHDLRADVGKLTTRVSVLESKEE
jgi:polyhydroxyalkanoate synthesis regulator phasin